MYSSFSYIFGLLVEKASHIVWPVFKLTITVLSPDLLMMRFEVGELVRKFSNFEQTFFLTGLAEGKNIVFGEVCG